MRNFEGKTIDRYRVIEPLGKGGMAIVYHAFDTRLERDVALKLIRTEAIPAEKHDTLIRRFEREAKAMSKFTHPNIVPVHDYGDMDGVPYLVMDYLPGGTLKKYTGSPIHYQNAAALLAPIADALAYAHSQNVIHRDVKPSNILITATNNVMLTDFGIAKVLEDQDITLTGTGLGVGTPHYMAPEQWKNRVTPSVDIYALGTIFYELVTGRRPYDAETPAAIAIQQATEPLERPRKYAPDLPESVEKTIFKALAFQPENRFLSMEDFHAVLHQISQGQLAPVAALVADVQHEQRTNPVMEDSITIDKLALPSQPPSRPQPQQQPTKMPWGWIIFGIVAVVGLLMFGAYQVLRGFLAEKPSTSPTQGIAFEQSLPEATETIARGGVPTEALPPIATDIPATATDVPATAAPQPTATQALGIGSSFTRDKDGMPMMYVPAGEFLMGSDDSDINAKANEKPQHTVFLDAYWMDKYEVSNAMFAEFVADTGYVTGAENWGYGYKYDASGKWTSYDGLYWRYPFTTSESYKDDLPVIQVNFFDAAAYCKWAGGRLPTEAEWEKAGRGTDGRLYSWGNSIDSSKANYNYTDGPVSVYSFSSNASPYGLLNMTGNIFEWTTDWYAADTYGQSPYENPVGPTSGEWRVLRGGGWTSGPKYIRITNRDISPPEYMNYLLGFRCVMDAD